MFGAWIDTTEFRDLRAHGAQSSWCVGLAAAIISSRRNTKYDKNRIIGEAKPNATAYVIGSAHFSYIIIPILTFKKTKQTFKCFIKKKENVYTYNWRLQYQYIDIDILRYDTKLRE